MFWLVFAFLLVVFLSVTVFCFPFLEIGGGGPVSTTGDELVMEVMMDVVVVKDLLWRGDICDGSVMGVVAAATDLSWR
ncbi:hypothetical protein TSUD_63690 [Trifolium subterraneum]|uniref:Secreted peptide n=1 Tax=Trifolium subterraneum TaxID=3900 RepID=A0A2Z6N687_TRISU|nr:hypothetical protein TSUD_63690 [Trifolium subterraneum]